MLAERDMKKPISLLMIGIFVFAAPGRAEVVNRIVATVDDEPITLYELKNFGKGPGGQRDLLGSQGGGAGVSDKDILEVLIMNKLVGKEVEAQGLKAKDADIDNYVERIKAQGNLDDEQLKAALAKQGMTMESYRQQISQEIERALLINREIGSHVNVTPQDVERYYKEHSDEYSQSQDEQVRIRHIFLPLSPAASPEEEKEAVSQIQDIRKRAVGGEDFASLADTYSRGPGAGQGGDLGFFKKGQMAKEIEEVAFPLKAGEISEPFRTNAGVHLLKVEEHTVPEQKASSLDPTTAEEIKRKLYNEALRQRYDRWFQEDLRFRHQVENFLTASSTSPAKITLKSAKRPEESPPTTEKEPEPKKGFFRRLIPF